MKSTTDTVQKGHIDSCLRFPFSFSIRTLLSYKMTTLVEPAVKGGLASWQQYTAAYNIASAPMLKVK